MSTITTSSPSEDKQMITRHAQVVKKGPTEKALISKLEKILEKEDMTRFRLSDVVDHLESHFCVNLDEKKFFINKHTTDYLRDRYGSVIASDYLPIPLRTTSRPRQPVNTSQLKLLTPQAVAFLKCPPDTLVSLRTLTRHVIAYVRRQGLVSPDDSKVIICDEPLTDLLGASRVPFFHLGRLLAQHTKTDNRHLTKKTEKTKRRRKQYNALPEELSGIDLIKLQKEIERQRLLKEQHENVAPDSAVTN